MEFWLEEEGPEKMTSINPWQVKRGRIAFWSIAAILLLLPLLAMQVTREVAWSGLDFAFLGSLLLATGLVMELAVRRFHDISYLSGLGMALLTAFVLIVVNGAVGIIGSEANKANLMFGAVLAIGVLGSLLARFKPSGMKRAMVATAAVQVGVAVIALVGKVGASGPAWPRDVIGSTAVLAAMWLLSAWLFRKAGPK